MSGHSKWHNIQKTKGAADAKRSQIFTKIAREMIVAVKQGGSGDPNNNSRLATVIAKAKAANMPNDNIKRTIDKALGSGNADDFESVVYEGYGPCGVAVIVEALTDNRNRTAPEVRHLLDKYGKGLGATGCVSWSFDQKGVIVIEREDLDEDTVMMDALDSGADDMQADEECFEITTTPDSFGEVLAKLEEKGYAFLSAGVDMVPQNYVKLEKEEDVKNMEKLIDLLEENDDVQNVYHKWVLQLATAVWDGCFCYKQNDTRRGYAPRRFLYASRPVSRVLSFKTAIYLDALLPTRSSHLPGTAGPAVCPSTVLLRIEFTSMGSLQPSGELLPHLSTLTSPTHVPAKTKSLQKAHSRGEAVSLCCTFPRVASGGRYPLSLPCGARTFLMNGLSALSTWLSSLLAVFYYIGREAHCQFD